MITLSDAQQVMQDKDVDKAVREWLAQPSALHLRAIHEAIADVWAWDREGEYRDYLVDAMGEEFDPDDVFESYERAQEWIPKLLASMRMAEFEDWRADRDADLYDAEMDRRFDAMREEGRI